MWVGVWCRWVICDCSLAWLAWGKKLSLSRLVRDRMLRKRRPEGSRESSLWDGWLESLIKYWSAQVWLKHLWTYLAWHTKTQQRERLLAYIMVVLLFVGIVLKKNMAFNTFARYLSKWKHNTYIWMWIPPTELSSTMFFEYKFHHHLRASDSGIWLGAKCPSDVHLISLGNGGNIRSRFRITAAFSLVQFLPLPRKTKYNTTA